MFEAGDWAVLGIYFALILGLGFYFSLQARRRVGNKSEAYMTGGGKIPTWVIGFSIWATTLSSLTYLGVPGLSFTSGWAFSFGQLTIIALAPLVILKIVPFFRRMKETTAYSYLEARYSKQIRWMGSSLFILFHIFRIAIVIYLPTTILIRVIPDINPYLITVIVGVVVILMTLWGGMKGVLWTDAIQGVILLVGMGIILIWSLSATNYNQYFAPKFLGRSDFVPTLVSASVFFIFISNLVQTTYQYIGSQDVVQRYKASDRIGKIRRSLWINAILAGMTTLLFYGAGNALFSYFASHVGDTSIVQNTISDPSLLTVGDVVGQAGAPSNVILPYFVITVLPVGLSGLIIAAVFAASQSTISSSLSSLATSIMVDFVVPNVPNLTDRKQLLITKSLVVIFGLFGTGLACVLIATNQGQIVQYFQTVFGFFGAPIAAVFLLGMFTKSANKYGAFAGVGFSFFGTLPIWILTQPFFTQADGSFGGIIQFNGLYIGLISFAIALGMTYGVSFMTNTMMAKRVSKDLTNLSWVTITPEFTNVIKAEKELEKLEGQAMVLRRRLARYNQITNKMQGKMAFMQPLMNVMNNFKNALNKWIVQNSKNYLKTPVIKLQSELQSHEQRVDAKLSEVKKLEEVLNKVYA